jgi:hypothetical protein
MILRNVCLDLPELPLVDNVEEVGELLVNNLHEGALHVHLPHPPDHPGIPGFASRQAAVARLNLGKYIRTWLSIHFSSNVARCEIFYVFDSRHYITMQ